MVEIPGFGEYQGGGGSSSSSSDDDDDPDTSSSSGGGSSSSDPVIAPNLTGDEVQEIQEASESGSRDESAVRDEATSDDDVVSGSRLDQNNDGSRDTSTQNQQQAGGASSSSGGSGTVDAGEAVAGSEASAAAAGARDATKRGGATKTQPQPETTRETGGTSSPQPQDGQQSAPPEGEDLTDQDIPPAAEYSGEEVRRLVDLQQSGASRDRIEQVNEEFGSNEVKTPEAAAQGVEERVLEESDTLSKGSQVEVVRDDDQLTPALTEQGQREVAEEVADATPGADPADVPVSRTGEVDRTGMEENMVAGDGESLPEDVRVDDRLRGDSQRTGGGEPSQDRPSFEAVAASTSFDTRPATDADLPDSSTVAVAAARSDGSEGVVEQIQDLSPIGVAAGSPTGEDPELTPQQQNMIFSGGDGSAVDTNPQRLQATQSAAYVEPPSGGFNETISTRLTRGGFLAEDEESGTGGRNNVVEQAVDVALAATFGDSVQLGAEAATRRDVVQAAPTERELTNLGEDVDQFLDRGVELIGAYAEGGPTGAALEATTENETYSDNRVAEAGEHGLKVLTGWVNAPAIAQTAETGTEVATNLPSEAWENPEATGATVSAAATAAGEEATEQATENPLKFVAGVGAGAVTELAAGAAVGRSLETGSDLVRTGVRNYRSEVGEVPPEAVFSDDVVTAMESGDAAADNIPPGYRPTPADDDLVDTVERTQAEEVSDELTEPIPGDEPVGVHLAPSESAPPDDGFRVMSSGKQRPDDPQGGFFGAPSGNPVVIMDEAGVGGPSPNSGGGISLDPTEWRLPRLRGATESAEGFVYRGRVEQMPDWVGNEGATQAPPSRTLNEILDENPDLTPEDAIEQSEDYAINNQGRIVLQTAGDESRYLQSRAGDPVQFVRSPANIAMNEAETVVPGETVVDVTNTNLAYTRVGDDIIRFRGARLENPADVDPDRGFVDAVRDAARDFRSDDRGQLGAGRLGAGSRRTATDSFPEADTPRRYAGDDIAQGGQPYVPGTGPLVTPGVSDGRSREQPEATPSGVSDPDGTTGRNGETTGDDTTFGPTPSTGAVDDGGPQRVYPPEDPGGTLSPPLGDSGGVSDPSFNDVYPPSYPTGPGGGGGGGSYGSPGGPGTPSTPTGDLGDPYNPGGPGTPTTPSGGSGTPSPPTGGGGAFTPDTPTERGRRRDPDQQLPEREPEPRPSPYPYDIPFRNPIATGSEVLFGGGYRRLSDPRPESENEPTTSQPPEMDVTGPAPEMGVAPAWADAARDQDGQRRQGAPSDERDRDFFPAPEMDFQDPAPELGQLDRRDGEWWQERRQ